MNRLRRLAGISGLIGIILIGSALAASPPPARIEDPAEERARTIAKELRCAVCQNQSVYDSNSDLAKDMLQVIREFVASGATDREIRDYFFQRYGDYIYLEPTLRGTNLILWLGPFAGLLIGGVALWAALRRSRPRPGPDPEAPPPAIDPAITATETSWREKIAQELKNVQI